MRISGVFEVVVANGEFRIGFLNVGIVDNTDIAAAEDGSFLGIAGYCELGEIEVELLFKVKGENERGHGFVSSPMLFA